TMPVTIFSSTYTVTVFPPLSVSVSPTSGITDVNQPIYLTGTVAGGTGFYSYEWLVDNVSQNDNSTTFSFESSTSGIFVVTFLVVDTHVSPSTSPYPYSVGVYSTITVHTGLSVTISALRDSIDQGQHVNITSNVTGGTGSYTYQWFVNNAKIVGATSDVYDFSPTTSTAPGKYSFYLFVEDSAGNYSYSNNITIDVSPALSISISAFPNAIAAGQESNITLTVTGGSGGLLFAWYIELPGSSKFVQNATTENYSFKTKSTTAYGTYSFYEVVTDSNGVSLKSNIVSVEVGKGYNVTFSESGLPSGTKWSVSVNGISLSSSSSDITFIEPNITYPYDVVPIISGGVGVRYIDFKPSGNVTIDGQPVTINVIFNTQFNVTFIASPSGTGTFSLAGGWYNKSTEISVLAEPSSGYVFGSWVGSGSGSYSGSKNPAVIWVNSTISETAIFDKLYQITVNETGLPAGSTWYFNITGLVFKSTGTKISFSEPNGTYSYVVGAPSGYYINPSSGSITVAGKSIFLNVTFTGVILITISPAKTSVDVNNSITFTNVTVGGSGSYVWTYTVNATSGFIRSGNTFKFTKIGNYTITLDVKDSDGHNASAVATVRVNPDMSVSLSGVPSVMDVGQNASISAVVSGGSAPYLYDWYVDGNLVSENNGTFDFVPTGVGQYKIYVVVIDSSFNHVSASSNISKVVVNLPLVVTISPATGQVDAGHSITITGAVSGGTGSYSFSWEVNGQIQSDTEETFIFTPSSNGTYIITFSVTDKGVSSSAHPFPYVVNATSTISVHSAFSVKLSASSLSMDQGQSVNLTLKISGGSGVFSYKWYVNGVATANSKPFYDFVTNDSTSVGNYIIYAEVTDSTGAISYSNNVTVVVYKALTVNVFASQYSIGSGGYSNLTTYVSGGHGVYSFKWYEEQPGASGYTQVGTNSYFNFSALNGALGNYSFFVNVKDGDNASVNSSVVIVSVMKGYTVYFVEHGLPKGVSWTVSFDGQFFTSNQSSMKFIEPNVTYSYVVESPIMGPTGVRYESFDSVGLFTVDGKDVNISVNFVTQYLLSVSVSPSNAGVVFPGTGWYNESSVITLSVSSGEYFVFSSWSGVGNGSYSGVDLTPSITMNGPI
ncbi:MAG: hypothetical protein QXU98_12745, partial [Candidatus Parvarchaeota archaeon]